MRKDLFQGNTQAPPSSKEIACKAHEYFGQTAEGVQRLRRKGEVVTVGNFNPGVGKYSCRGQAIGQHGGDKVSYNGENMLESLGSIELMVLNGRRECDPPELTRKRAVCKENSFLDFTLVDRGSTQILMLHVSAIDVDSTDHFRIWANIDRTRKAGRNKQKKVFHREVENLGGKDTRGSFQMDRLVAFQSNC